MVPEIPSPWNGHGTRDIRPLDRMTDKYLWNITFVDIYVVKLQNTVAYYDVKAAENLSKDVEFPTGKCSLSVCYIW